MVSVATVSERSHPRGTHFLKYYTLKYTLLDSRYYVKELFEGISGCIKAFGSKTLQSPIPYDLVEGKLTISINLIAKGCLLLKIIQSITIQGCRY